MFNHPFSISRQSKHPRMPHHSGCMSEKECRQGNTEVAQPLLPNCRPMCLPTLQQSECFGYPSHLKVENNELSKHELSIWWFLYMFLASSSLSEPPTAKLMFEKHILRWGEREREGGINSSHIFYILPMNPLQYLA